MTEAIAVPADFTVEFASAEWFDLYQKACIAACRLGAMPDGVTCEVYRDVPAHLAAGGALAWTRRVAGGSCSLEFVECADKEAASKLHADYAGLLPLAGCIIGEDESAFLTMAMELIASGKMEIIRHDAHSRANHLVHNLMAALTQ